MAGRVKRRTTQRMSAHEMMSRDKMHDRLGGPESDAHQPPRMKKKKRKGGRK